MRCPVRHSRYVICTLSHLTVVIDVYLPAFVIRHRNLARHTHVHDLFMVQET